MSTLASFLRRAAPEEARRQHAPEESARLDRPVFFTDEIEDEGSQAPTRADVGRDFAGNFRVTLVLCRRRQSRSRDGAGTSSADTGWREHGR
jgi:hypothetical protein